MFDSIKEFFARAWEWIQAVWAKHDDELGKMVEAILPMVVAVTFREDLKGFQKRQVIFDAILDGAEMAASKISSSVINEAIEIAANRYNIQLGKLTVDKLDNAKDAVLKAGRDFSNGKLDLTGTEAEDAGVSLTAVKELTAEEIAELVDGGDPVSGH